jgi:hypothetical protein
MIPTEITQGKLGSNRLVVVWLVKSIGIISC